MAEGGFEEIDPLLIDDDEGAGDTTTPFQPGASSTPGPQGEQIEMQTMQHEKSGLPETSYAETSFGGRHVTNEEIERRLYNRFT